MTIPEGFDDGGIMITDREPNSISFYLDITKEELQKLPKKAVILDIGSGYNEFNKIENIVKKEIKQFMDSTQAHKVVLKVIQNELGTKKIDDKIIDLSTKVVVELFKTLWLRKGFWDSAIKNVR